MRNINKMEENILRIDNSDTEKYETVLNNSLQCTEKRIHDILERHPGKIFVIVASKIEFKYAVKNIHNVKNVLMWVKKEDFKRLFAGINKS